MARPQKSYTSRIVFRMSEPSIPTTGYIASHSMWALQGTTRRFRELILVEATIYTSGIGAVMCVLPWRLALPDVRRNPTVDRHNGTVTLTVQ